MSYWGDERDLRDAVAREIARLAGTVGEQAFEIEEFVEQMWPDYRDGASAIIAMALESAGRRALARATGDDVISESFYAQASGVQLPRRSCSEVGEDHGF